MASNVAAVRRWRPKPRGLCLPKQDPPDITVEVCMTLPADLMSHPLLGRLMIDTKPLLQEAVRWLGTKAEKHGWVRRKRPPASLRLPDSYYYGVFYHAVTLGEALRPLDDISLHLRYVA